MPSMRQQHQRKVEQAIRSNDKAIMNASLLLETFNTTGLEPQELYEAIIQNPDIVPKNSYTNITLTLVSVLYHASQMDEALSLLRQQI